MSAYSDWLLKNIAPDFYLRHGEGSGPTHQDATANNLDGTSGAGLVFGKTGSLSGDSDTCIEFTHTNVAERVDVVYTIGNVQTIGGRAWLKDEAGSYAIWGLTNTAAWLRFATGRNLSLGVANADVATWNNAIPAVEAWFSWAIKFDLGAANTAELFINGESKGVKEVVANLAGPGTIQFGEITSSTNTYRGKQDENWADNSLVSAEKLTFLHTLAESGPSKPEVVTGETDDITVDSATLNGTVDPNWFDTDYYFEYVDAAQFAIDEWASATAVPAGKEGAAGEGTTSAAVDEEVEGLEGGTLYHVRLVATNVAGTTNGSGKTFETEPSPVPAPPPEVAPVTTLPHLSHPFRIMGNAAVTVEQDSHDEIADCVLAALNTPEGSRIEAPEYGIPDELFTQLSADPSAEPYLVAVEEAEPRAHLLGESEIEGMTKRVLIEGDPR